MAAEVAQEYNARRATSAQDECKDLISIATEIVPFFISHNAEADACDLLMELEIIPDILPHVDTSNYQRVTLYLSR